MIPRKVWCFWVGGHSMSPARARCLESVRLNIGVPVELVTDETLNNYILPDHPLHEGYQYLSGTTKCDYLRTYFMHHYGGGYTDIKETGASWAPHFERLQDKMDAYVLGYREWYPTSVAYIAEENPHLYAELRSNYSELIGNGSFICRPGTIFTTEWYETLLKRMDLYLPALKLNPAKHARDALSSESKFPIPWGGVAAFIFHPLCLRYLDNILYDLPVPNCCQASYI